jgi:ribosomal protein S18 acetylase RimI-like enzyme
MNTPGEPAIEIRPLTEISLEMLREIIIGHVTQEVFSVSSTETESEIHFSLKLKSLPTKKGKEWQPDEEDMAEYQKAFSEGTCVAAFMGEKIVGVAISNVRKWNKSLWVMEFHVHPDHHRKGIGWLMMEEIVDIAKDRGLRVIVCETQNTNVSAIRFYQAMGFTMDGIDLSYYSNEDYRNDAIAVFMKRKIE